MLSNPFLLSNLHLFWHFTIDTAIPCVVRGNKVLRTFDPGDSSTEPGPNRFSPASFIDGKRMLGGPAKKFPCHH